MVNKPEKRSLLTAIPLWAARTNIEFLLVRGILQPKKTLRKKVQWAKYEMFVWETPRKDYSIRLMTLRTSPRLNLLIPEENGNLGHPDYCCK